MKPKFLSLSKSCFVVVIYLAGGFASATPGLFPDGLHLDSAGDAKLESVAAWPTTTRAALQLSNNDGGVVLYSAAQGSSAGGTDGGVLLWGSPVAVVLDQGSGNDAATFKVWSSEEYYVPGSPLFTINGTSGASTVTGSAVAVNGGSLKVDGSAVLTASSAPSFLTGQNFLQLSGGVLALASTTPSTDSTTGALTVAGGIGVALDSHINGVRVGKGPGHSFASADNTVFGQNALSSNVGGRYNVAVGKGALQANIGAQYNTAVGYGSLAANTSGAYNTATGYKSLTSSTVGSHSTAMGFSALSQSTTGVGNTAVGANSLGQNTTGSTNSAQGLQALYANTTGSGNVAMGTASLGSSTTGNQNSGYGLSALGRNTTGSNNVAVGYQAGIYAGTGSSWLYNSNDSIYIGSMARGFDHSETNAIVIGAGALGQGSNTTVIGNSSTVRTHLFGSLEAGALTVEGTHDTWNETDALLVVGNGATTFNTSAAISTRKNGQTTLTNKAWKADSAVAPSPSNSDAEALVVEGHTVLKGNTRLMGKVAIDEPQGDISMGIYGN